MLTLSALIKRTEKALASEKSVKRRAQLRADLEAYKKTKYRVEEEETEESEEEEEEEEEEESADGGNDTDREESARSDDMPGDDKKRAKKSKKAKSEEEEEESASSEEEEEEASAEEDDGDDADAHAEEDDDGSEESAVAALLGNLKGRKADRARGVITALLADAKRGRRADAQVRKLTATQARERLYASVDTALGGRRITRSEAKWLKAQPKATVDSFLKTRKGPIVLGDEDAHQERNPSQGHDPHQAAAALSPQMDAVLTRVAMGAGVPIEKLREMYKPTMPNGVRGGDVSLGNTGGAQRPGGN
jgi:hypothetical protein